MKNTKHVAVLAFAFLMALSPLAEAARSVPVDDSVNAVPNYGSKPPTAADVRKAIIKSALQRGWQPINDTGGKVRLQLDEKKRGAYRLVVDVVYTAKNYTIKYVSSDGLRYNEEQRTIHSSYSRWLNMLVKTVNREIANATM